MNVYLILTYSFHACVSLFPLVTQHLADAMHLDILYIVQVGIYKRRRSSNMYIYMCVVCVLTLLVFTSGEENKGGEEEEEEQCYIEVS